MTSVGFHLIRKFCELYFFSSADAPASGRLQAHPGAKCTAEILNRWNLGWRRKFKSYGEDPGVWDRMTSVRAKEADNDYVDTRRWDNLELAAKFV